MLKEAVCYSQRVEKFEVLVKENETWNRIFTGTVIGYQKIIPVKGQKAREVKIVLHDFRVLPLLSFVGIYPENPDKYYNPRLDKVRIENEKRQSYHTYKS